MKVNRPGKDMLQRLRNCILFCDLSPLQFNSIVDHSSVVKLKEGDTLFEQEDETTAFFFLDSGQVKLTRLAPDGNEKVIDIINAGQTFAEAVVFGGLRGYPVSANAITDSEVVSINSMYYRDFISNCSDASLSLLANMSRRLHWQLNEIDSLTLHTAAYRLICFLLEQLASERDGGREIHLKTPKHVIASRLTIKPETLSRTLKKLSSAGLIEVHDNTIEVKDKSKLEEYIQLEGQGQKLV